jgi:hypothetical protein
MNIDTLFQQALLAEASYANFYNAKGLCCINKQNQAQSQ